MKYLKEYWKALLKTSSVMGLLYLILCAIGINGGQVIALYFLFLSGFAALGGPVSLMISH